MFIDIIHGSNNPMFFGTVLRGRILCRSRRGLTLIEVLSAIGVAAIGVFGILVLVPLASRMSQVGISNDSTRQNAANVVERAKSFGALNTNRWAWFDGNNSFGPLEPVPPQIDPSNVFCIDPMLIAAPNFNPALPETDTRTIRVFPHTSGAPTVLPIRRVSIFGQNGPVGAAFAEAMLGQRTMLKTVPALSDVLPPTQAFVRDLATNIPMRREAEGVKSALLLVLPASGMASNVHRLMSLVVSNRRYETTNFDRVFEVRTLNDQFVFDKPSGVLDLRFLELSAVAVGPNLKSRGWVIVVPVNPLPGGNFYSWQHARPYQIRSSETSGNGFDVSLIGPSYASPTGANGLMRTHAIYLPDVVDIREVEVRLGTSE